MDKATHDECIKRLNILKEQGLITDIDVMGRFEKGLLCISEKNEIFGEACGVIFPLEGRPSYGIPLKESVFPRLRGTPYMLMAQDTNMGKMITVLFVSAFPEEWERERDELYRKVSCACVYNMKFGGIDIGYIRYEMMNGGPVRIN